MVERTNTAKTKVLVTVFVIVLPMLILQATIITATHRELNKSSPTENIVNYNNTTIFTTINYCNTTNCLTASEKNTNRSFENGTIATDVEAPKIINAHAMPPIWLVNSNVTIISTVIDDTAVECVKVNITGPAGFTTINVTMTCFVAPCYYYENTYSIPGNYSYYIWVNDTSNNANCSPVYQFQIVSPKFASSISINDSCRKWFFKKTVTLL